MNNKGVDLSIQLSKDLVNEERAETEVLEQKVNASVGSTSHLLPPHNRWKMIDFHFLNLNPFLTQYDVYKKWIEDQVSEASGMTEQQTGVLQEISAKLAPRIQELCENKIAENLRLVNEQTAKKLENMLIYIQDSTATFCETLLADHERLSKRMVEMQETIETSKREQVEAAKRRNDFSQVKLNFFIFHYFIF